MFDMFLCCRSDRVLYLFRHLYAVLVPTDLHNIRWRHSLVIQFVDHFFPLQMVNFLAFLKSPAFSDIVFMSDFSLLTAMGTDLSQGFVFTAFLVCFIALLNPS